MRDGGGTLTSAPTTAEFILLPRFARIGPARYADATSTPELCSGEENQIVSNPGNFGSPVMELHRQIAKPGSPVQSE